MVVVNNVTGLFWVISGTKISLNSLKYRRKERQITWLLEILDLCDSVIRWYIFTVFMSDVKPWSLFSLGWSVYSLLVFNTRAESQSKRLEPH